MMRFALSFLAILVVSWTYRGEAVATGAKKSVKDLVSGFDNPSNGGSPSSGVKTVTIDGVQRSVKDLVKIYESYTKAKKGSPAHELLPTKQEVENGLQSGKGQEVANRICEAETDSDTDEEKDTLIHMMIKMKSGTYEETDTESEEETDTESEEETDTESDGETFTVYQNSEPFWWKVICSVRTRL